ncbi:MinD/ParA family protein [Clostridiales bacterium COT073_COT-073]|nr:MinD/ParA family protein [Clostridiales bacterium COT073_COT-073]
MDQAAKLRDLIYRSQQNQSDQATAKRARVITVTSGKGGVGKSNISVNLAVQFQKQGKKVVIFDADFGLANVEVIFGILPKYNIFDLIVNKMSIFDVLTEGPMGIRFLSGGSGIGQLLNLSADQIEYLVKQLEILDEHADIIIIDTGAGINEAVLAFAFVSGEILIVTTPEPTAITDAYALIKSICNSPQFYQTKPRMRLIVNKSRSPLESQEVFDKLNKVTERFLNLSLENLGYLPDDRALVDAVIERKPFSIIYPKAAVTKGIEDIAARILLENQTEIKSEMQPKGLSSIFNRIFRRK